MSEGETQLTRSIAVVHLIRACNPPQALTRFISSYRQYRAGLAHRLIFLFKGFDGNIPEEILTQTDLVRHTKLFCTDKGFDIGAYFFAAHALDEKMLLFTNSFSLLQADGWLQKFVSAYDRGRVGVVGATGSWETLSLNVRRFNLLDAAAMLLLFIPLRIFFPAFPNPHVRSNGFYIARADFIALQPKLLAHKYNAWMFESGRYSMTRRLQKRGLATLVIGKNGAAYDMGQWAQSNTFWQTEQQNLLIHDNRTMEYEQGTPELRARLRRSAWGDKNQGPRL